MTETVTAALVRRRIIASLEIPPSINDIEGFKTYVRAAQAIMRDTQGVVFASGPLAEGGTWANTGFPDGSVLAFRHRPRQVMVNGVSGETDLAYARRSWKTFWCV